MRWLPAALLAWLLPATTLVACDDSSSSSTTSPGSADGGAFVVDGGATGPTPGDAATSPDAASGGACEVSGGNYAIYASQLFKVSEDLTLSTSIGASVTSAIGTPFGSSTTGVQIGSDLIVSDPSCPFCKIPLPPTIVDGKVKAEPIVTGFTAVKYFFSPGIPNNVVVWSGNGTSFTLFDLATKTEVATAGVLVSGPGVLCNKLYAITGTIAPTSYSVRILAECGDGSGPTWATIADTSGAKVGSNWQQSSFQTVATTKNLDPKPQITAGDFARNIFLAGTKVYKQDLGTFALDTATYRQCNPATGKSVDGAKPLIPTPR